MVASLLLSQDSLLPAMQHSSRSLSDRSVHGGSIVPILIVVMALALSTAIFFLFTKKKMQGNAQEAAAPAAAGGTTPAGEPGKAAADAAKAGTPVAPAMPPKVEPPPAPKPAPVAFAFARPLDLGRQLARSLTAGDFASAGKLAAAADEAQSESAAQLFQKLAEMGYKPGAEDQVELLGLVENRTRLAVPFTKPGSTETVHIQLDLERDERMGWKIAKATLPKSMSSVVAVMPAPPPPGLAAGAVGAVPPPRPGMLAPTKHRFPDLECP